MGREESALQAPARLICPGSGIGACGIPCPVLIVTGHVLSAQQADRPNVDPQMVSGIESYSCQLEQQLSGCCAVDLEALLLLNTGWKSSSSYYLAVCSCFDKMLEA